MKKETQPEASNTNTAPADTVPGTAYEEPTIVTPAKKKAFSVNIWVAAAGVGVVLGGTYLAGRYFGYQAALRAVAAAASRA